LTARVKKEVEEKEKERGQKIKETKESNTLLERGVKEREGESGRERGRYNENVCVCV